MLSDTMNAAAGLVKHPSDYPWSSYQHRALGKMDRLLDHDPWYLGLGINAVCAQKRDMAVAADVDWLRVDVKKFR
jgi:hypothetical protein